MSLSKVNKFKDISLKDKIGFGGDKGKKYFYSEVRIEDCFCTPSALPPVLMSTLFINNPKGPPYIPRNINFSVYLGASGLLLLIIVPKEVAESYSPRIMGLGLILDPAG